MEVNFLTGIKPTGLIHLGNYIGAIKPIEDILQNEENRTILLFIADYHAITSRLPANELSDNIRDIMISYKSIVDANEEIMEKNNNRVIFYRQSEIPEIFELYWILCCYTAKGLLNRNHSYKQETQNNIDRGKDPDKAIFMGLFNYPVLMAADILMFDPDFVPVGKDQYQHLEIANDISHKVNHVTKSNILKEIQPLINKDNYVLPGKGGDKMSKSYNNTVPMFTSEKKLRKYIFGIKTNCKGFGDPKYPDESMISNICKAFGTKSQYTEFVLKMEAGLEWKDLKEFVFDIVNSRLSKYRKCYESLNKDFHDLVLEPFEDNEVNLREEANEKLYEIKDLMGIGGNNLW